LFVATYLAENEVKNQQKRRFNCQGALRFSRKGFCSKFVFKQLFQMTVRIDKCGTNNVFRARLFIRKSEMVGRLNTT
jgi:hypothetical protein